MKTTIRNSIRGLLLIPLVLACFGLLPAARAVTPAPDGGYNGFNTAEGQNALLNLTSGVWNTALGGQALFKDTSGNTNTAVGLNTLYFNTSGSWNTALGAQTAQNFSSGSFNTAIGAQALMNNTADGNTAVGYQALFTNQSGFGNTATGLNALASANSVSFNTANGYKALANNDNFFNTAVGFDSQFSSTGEFNTTLGFNSGNNNTSGSDNIYVGSYGIDGENFAIRIGFPEIQFYTATYIDGIFNEPGGTQFVAISSTGKLGFFTSSRRFKDEIKPMDKTSEVIYALKPVSFRYKAEIEPTRPLSFGLIAEDVEKVNPNLVLRDNKGNVNSVRYEAVNAMLLNEFLKEHRKVEELQATVAQQQKGMEVLAASLKEQASQIQKVSAQLELNKPAPRTVLNNP